MRESHPVFDRGVDPAASVWRYFDLPKFLAMLQQRALYFCRADLLGDRMEGSFTRAHAAEREALLANPPEGRTREQLLDIFRHNQRIFAETPRETYVNCWHVGDHESMAMWQGYGAGAYGVAIRSTFGRLDEALPEKFSGPWREETIYLGRVRYLDYLSLTERVPNEHNSYAPFVCKSVVYQHEQEVRAIFLDSSVRSSETPAVGHFIRLELEQLIEAVIVSPLAPQWFREVIANACKAHGIDVSIAPSVAMPEPIF